jgi:ferredoxin
MSDQGVLTGYADPGLLADLRRYGKFDTAACYQCGSCTLSCELVTERVSLPRRVIRYGLLGMRRPLVGSLVPWICHDCGDCSSACPRDAEPRLSMMTTRRFLAARYDWTGMASRLSRSRAWYVGSLVGAALLMVALIVGFHVWYKQLPAGDFATTPMSLEHMFPMMVYFALIVTLGPLALLLSQGLRMWWFTMRGGGAHIPISAYLGQARVYALHSVAQPLMRKCKDTFRWKWHWMLGTGLVIKLTILVFALRWFQTDTIHPLLHPQRWLGYLMTVLLLAGAGGILLCRIRGATEACKSSELRDVMFPSLLVLAAVSGIVAHVLRIAGLPMACHYAYALHVVVTVPVLVVEIPFGKPSHMILRPLALYFQAVRERAGLAAPAVEGAERAA